MVELIQLNLAKNFLKFYNLHNCQMELIDLHNLDIFFMGIKVSIMDIFGHKFIQRICLLNSKKLVYLTRILEGGIKSIFLRQVVQKIH